jgi:hypothetical protein
MTPPDLASVTEFWSKGILEQGNPEQGILEQGQTVGVWRFHMRRPLSLPLSRDQARTIAI